MSVALRTNVRLRVATAAASLLAACAAPEPATPAAPAPAGPPGWRRIVVDPAFRAEAIAAADVDRDGDLDLFAGDVWYEAPAWRVHPIRDVVDHGDGSASYSRTFACFAGDVDRDGFADQLVVGMPGEPALWFRNPGAARDAAGPWAAHPIHPTACNESPAFVDLFGDGERVLLLGDGDRLVWCEPAADATAPWRMHPISEPGCPAAQRFAHGLGAGDLDGDGRLDVVTPFGWWRQPPNARAHDGPWPERRVRTCFDSAQLYTLDVDRDGRADVLASSAHARGVCWNAQRTDAGGATFFTPRVLTEHSSQTHALRLADVDGDGEPDLVTGKRWWAHGPTGDVDPAGTPWLFWIELERGPEPRHTVHPIDDASGVGTAFEVIDLDGDGRLDVATANKRGVFVFLQQPR